ncbi:MAG: hypothetical protein JWM55_588 [Acidimicrobiaceae bacterium]|nr:hypothetical protein [Acidimicrobiaceae bacterium]
MTVSYNRQQIIFTLHRAGFNDAAKGAETELPEEVDIDTLETWSAKYGITRDAIVSQIGGSS